MVEYQAIDVPKNPVELTGVLNAKQADGWEVMALYERIQPVVATGGTILVGVFRRITEPQQ